METNFYGNQKVTFLTNICKTLRELESFIVVIQMKDCIDCFLKSKIVFSPIHLHSPKKVMSVLVK